MRQYGDQQPFSDDQPTQQWTDLGDFAEPEQENVDPATESLHIAMKQKKHHVWPAVVISIVVLVAAACGGAFWFFQSHALPGVSLWGHNVAGKSVSQITDEINDTVDHTTVPVSYDGKTATVSLKDLGVSVDADQIAREVVNAKRDQSWTVQYLPWEHQNVNPTIDTTSTNPAVLNEKLGIDTVKPVDASLKVNDDGKTIDIVNAVTGTGADPKAAVNEAVTVVESLGTQQPKTVAVTLSQIEPAISDTVAKQAQTTLQQLVDKPVTIKVGGHDIGSFNATQLMNAAKVNPAGTAGQGQVKVGDVIFSADKLQDAYEQDIKSQLQTTKKDQDEIVNNDGDVLEITNKGHDGVKIDDGADTNIGTDAIAAISKGGTTVNVNGTVDPMTVNKTKRHIVVDLSDHKVYAYENGKEIRSFWMSAGQGNDYETGKCINGDLCTPMGDFKMWLKYESQDMSGNLTLSDGSKESWDVKNVGFVNYFSKSGCAIHRIASSEPFTNEEIHQMGKNTSHGCVGIGWDVADWFYNWALMGTTVHVQA